MAFTSALFSSGLKMKSLCRLLRYRRGAVSDHHRILASRSFSNLLLPKDPAPKNRVEDRKGLREKMDNFYDKVFDFLLPAAAASYVIGSPTIGVGGTALLYGYLKIRPMFQQTIPYQTKNLPNEMEYLFYVRWVVTKNITASIDGNQLTVTGYDRARPNTFPFYTVKLPPGMYRKENIKVYHNEETGIAYVNIKNFNVPTRTIDVQGIQAPGYASQGPKFEVTGQSLAPGYASQGPKFEVTGQSLVFTSE